MALPDLLAALRRDPDDESTWAILGDLLASSGDRRGELIALEQRALACERPFERSVLEHQARDLFEAEHRSWLGPLAQAGLDLEWRRGFIIQASVGRHHVRTLEQLAALPVTGLLRKLVLVRPRPATISPRLAKALISLAPTSLELRLGPGSGAGLGPAGRGEGVELTGLDVLATVEPLRELSIDGAGELDLAALAELPALDQLALPHLSGSLTGLSAGFADLRVLDLSARPGAHALGPEALAPLAGLTKLERLSLRDGGWTELAPLTELSALTTLDLSSTDIVELGELGSLTKLEDLALAGCTPITNIDALARLTQLRRLNLAYTRVRRLGALASLAQLEVLELAGTPIHDLSPVFGLPALRKVGLQACEVDDVQPLVDRGVTLVGLRTPSLSWREVAEQLLRRP